MSLSRDQMLELMQFADGELDGDEAARARVEELVRADEEAREILAAMGGLGDVVREGAAQAAQGGGYAAADGIADQVMGAIAAADAGLRPGTEGAGGRVVPLAAARRAREGAAAAVVTALALAAGALLVLKGPGPSRVAEAPIDVAPSGATAAEPASALAQAASASPAPGAGVDLEEARSKENKLNVFFVPSSEGANAATSVVVWIDDHGGGGH